MRNIPKNSNKSRRRILQAMSLTGAAAASLPVKWKKPTIDAALLPAHAEASGPSVLGGGCDLNCSATGTTFEIQMSWNNNGLDELPNFDLIVRTPNGNDVGPGSGEVQQGVCIEHNGNASTGSSGLESVQNSNNNIYQSGTFQVFIRQNHLGLDALSNVTVRAGFCGSHSLPSALNLNFPPDAGVNAYQVGTIVIGTDGGVNVSWTIPSFI